MQDVNHQLFTESVEEEILLSMKEKKGKTILLIIHDIELSLFLLQLCDPDRKRQDQRTAERGSG